MVDGVAMQLPRAGVTRRGAGGRGGEDGFTCGNDDSVVWAQEELICQSGTGIRREVTVTNLGIL